MTYMIPDQYVGMMPNQIEGTLNGKPFYFRARHGGWTLRVSPEDEEVIDSGESPSAGWWSQEEAVAFCKQILEKHSGAN
jgi:hypothetical protein